MSDWSDDSVLSFLEAYQNEPCIWNSRDANHKNRQKVNDAWTRLDVNMNKIAKDLKNKKEILMSTFRRHLKKKQDSIRSGAGAEDVYKSIWFAYEIMESFLGPIYTCTKNISTEEEESSQEISNKTAAMEDEEIEDNNLVQPSTSLHSPKAVTSRRRLANNLAEQQMSSAFGQLTNILTKRQKENLAPQKEDDDCDLYAKLLAKKLRELPPDDRKLVMYDIDTLFINRIKENIRRRTLSSQYSTPYHSNRPSTSKTSYSEPCNASPFSNRPPSSHSSHSEPLPNASPISNQPSTSQTVLCEPLPSINYATPQTIHIISNELVAPRTGQNIVNAELLKAYEDFDYREIE